MTRVADDLKLMADLNGGRLDGVERDPDRLLTLLKRVRGDDATLQDWATMVQRYNSLARHGRWLATFIVTYGILPRPLIGDDLEALDLAQPYAHALRVRQQVEAAVVGAGGVGSDHYYATYTDGDMKEARRLRHEALAAQVLR